MNKLNQTEMDRHLLSLNRKLELLSLGQEIGLTPQEAIIYGIEQADEWPFDYKDPEEEFNEH